MYFDQYRDDMQKYGIGNPENPLGKNDNSKIGRGSRSHVGVKGAENMPGPGA